MLRGWIQGFLALWLVCVLFSVSASAKTSYGKELTDARVVTIGELTGSPEKYLGEKVRIAGLVEDVCPMKGCWIDILESGGRETIRFKVDDGVIVFPVEARGSEVVAEGVLRKHEMSKRRATSWMRHLADEKGEPFDEASVTGPMVFYQIEGHGAELSR
ncbi:MAG: DUF4920 domain-containing protein [Myxococcota bacterium]|nr:hypothetical protein [Spirochaeta sp.]RPG03384.1 MAG: DUF4920 domain-containing protein [Proteobacteria bacterium TMED72]